MVLRVGHRAVLALGGGRGLPALALAGPLGRLRGPAGHARPESARPRRFGSVVLAFLADVFARLLLVGDRAVALRGDVRSVLLRPGGLVRSADAAVVRAGAAA